VTTTRESVIDLIEKTYKLLSEAKEKEGIYSTSNAFKQDIFTIEIALCLLQLGFFANKSIEKSEEYWFDGGYYIHYDLDGSWEALANCYSEIVRIIKEFNFFR
jgi:hypothetical protein